MVEKQVAQSPTTAWGTDWFNTMAAALKDAGVPALEVFTAAQQRNIEAIAAANQVAIEGAQAAVKRHMEMVQRYMAEVAQGAEAVARASSPQAKAISHAEAMKQAYEHFLADAREMRELIQHANTEALDVLHRRFTSAIAEVEEASHTVK